MLRKIGLLGIALLFFATPVLAGKHGRAGKSNVAHLYLYEKDPSDWTIVDDGAWGKMKYNLESPEFCLVFNGHALETDTDYSLIYYADPWPSTNGFVIVSGMSNEYGDIHFNGCFDIGSLPVEEDANYELDDDGNQSGGAKLWLVLSSDYDGTSWSAWNPTEYLFEHNLIAYVDTG